MYTASPHTTRTVLPCQGSTPTLTLGSPLTPAPLAPLGPNRVAAACEERVLVVGVLVGSTQEELQSARVGVGALQRRRLHCTGPGLKL